MFSSEFIFGKWIADRGSRDRRVFFLDWIAEIQNFGLDRGSDRGKFKIGSRIADRIAGNQKWIADRGLDRQKSWIAHLCH